MTRVQAEAGLTSDEAIARLRRDGPNEIPERRRHPGLRFAKHFWGLSAWMLELIAILSLVLEKRFDFWISLGLLLVNAVLGFRQEQRASAAVESLRQRLHVTARVLRDGRWRSITARTLVEGDVVRVRAGDFVPADIRILESALRVDQSALTGESRDIGKGPDELVYSGSVVRHGEATGVVVGTGTRTYFGRTTHLVESAHPKLHVEEVISRVVKWLFAIVGALVAVTIAVSLVEGRRFLDILPLSLVLLMSAIPIALPVMFTVSMAVGAIDLARRGVLVTQLNAVEDAANMDLLCADKTGTLTMNRLALTGAVPQAGFSVEDVIRFGALASNEADQDPIDLAFLEAARGRRLLDAPYETDAFVPFSPKTRRTEARITLDGRRVRVVKGALRTVAEEAKLEPSTLTTLDSRAETEARKGIRVLAVARALDGDAVELVGLAFLYDPPRPDSRRLIGELRSLGVGVKMLTGDALPVAREIAHQLGLGEVVRAHELRATQSDAGLDAAALVRGTDGFAEVFPEDKFLVVKSAQAAGHVVGMTGDGVNDAPALRQAEVGIAVGGATDVAKGAASVVLTTEGLESIVDLVRHGRAIYQRVLTWIVNKISQTILKAGFVVAAFLVTGKFVITAMGMLLLVFMTDFGKIALSTDRVRPSQRPETWNIWPLVRVSIVLGLLMLIEALGVLAIGWDRFGLGNDAGRLQTFTFETLLYFSLFSIVSVRERRGFWRSRPSRLVVASLAAAAFAGLWIGIEGLGGMRPISIGQTGFVILVSMLCLLGVNDLLKTILTARATMSQGRMRIAQAEISRGRE